MNILVIDDSAADAALLSHAIQSRYPEAKLWKYQAAEPGLEALSSSDINPDLIFLDVNMPEMDGWEVLQQVKEHQDLCKLPIIMTSTDQDEAIVRQCRELGAADFLGKSMDFFSYQKSLTGILEKQFTNNPLSCAA